MSFTEVSRFFQAVWERPEQLLEQIKTAALIDNGDHVRRFRAFLQLRNFVIQNNVTDPARLAQADQALYECASNWLRYLGRQASGIVWNPR